MINTTLCYIRRGEDYLMLHRIKKQNDLNQDKWIGVGGKFEDKESPEDCALREIREETGLTATGYRYRGLVTFLSDRWPTEYMHLFTVHSWTGELKEGSRVGPQSQAKGAPPLGWGPHLSRPFRPGRPLLFPEVELCGGQAGGGRSEWPASEGRAYGWGT